MKATERLFLIANYINRHPGVTARQLAERYDVSLRSIYRDINRLDQVGIQVISKDGGYMLIDRPTKFSAYLSVEEYLALTISPLLNNKEYQQAYYRALDKILSQIRISEEALKKMESLSNKIRIHEGKRGKEDGEHLNKIIQALTHNTSIKCTYYTMSRDDTTERMIDPYCLVPKAGHLYLIGFCHNRKDFRTFRLNRFKKIESTNNEFIIKGDFNIEEYLDKVWGIIREEEEVTFTVRFSKEVARYVKEAHYEQQPAITDLDDGSILFEVTIRGTVEFLRWVKQYGKDAEIISPKKYRQKMLEEIKEMQAIYELN